jgi:hypothetical protein
MPPATTCYIPVRRSILASVSLTVRNEQYKYAAARCVIYTLNILLVHVVTDLSLRPEVLHMEIEVQGYRKVRQPTPDTCSICQKIRYIEIRK